MPFYNRVEELKFLEGQALSDRAAMVVRNIRVIHGTGGSGGEKPWP